MVAVASSFRYISDRRDPLRADSSIISKYLVFTIFRTEETSTYPSKCPSRWTMPSRLERPNSQGPPTHATPRRPRKHLGRSGRLMPLLSLTIVNRNKSPLTKAETMPCSVGCTSHPNKDHGVLSLLMRSPLMARSGRLNRSKNICPSQAMVARLPPVADGSG